jgi:acetyl esterase
VPLDPQAVEVIRRRALSSIATPDRDGRVSLAERRRSFMATWREFGAPVAATEDHELPGTGPDVPVRIYWPSRSEPLPAVIIYHGGGFVFGGIESYDPLARRLCNALGAVVINVGYRLAPEDPYPAAPEDCFAAYRWVRSTAKDLGVDPERIAVLGDSAGANLSSVVCLMSRDRGIPLPACQVLLCPTVDPHFTESTHDRELTPPGGRDWWWKEYLGLAFDRPEAYATPLRAEDLSGLPPALVITAEYDELRDEGNAYADALHAAGVEVEHECYAGQWHVFHMYPSHVDAAVRAVEHQLRFLRTHLLLSTRE